MIAKDIGRASKTIYQERLRRSIFFVLPALELFTVSSLVAMTLVPHRSWSAPKRRVQDDTAREADMTSHVFMLPTRYMAATAHLIHPHSPRTYVVCPSIASDPAYQLKCQSQYNNLYSLPYCSNPSIWSKLDRNHLYPRPLAPTSPFKKSSSGLTSQKQKLHRILQTRRRRFFGK